MSDPISTSAASAKKEKEEMRAALGGAINAWAMVEGNLSHLFQRAVTARNSAAASAAFSAILSFEAQWAMVNATMRLTYSKRIDVLETWGRLGKRIEKLRPLRNKLAHGQILSTHNLASGEYSVDFLPFHHSGTHKGAEAYAHWSKDDLAKLERAFKQFSGDLWNLYSSLFADEALRPLSPEPDLTIGRAAASKRVLPRKRRTRTRARRPQ